MENLTESIRPLLVGITAGLVAGILVIDVMLPSQLAGMLYVALVMISMWSTKRSFTLSVAAACTALIMLDFRYAPMGGQSLAIASRALALFAIWATAILAVLYRQGQEDIQLLRSLLSLCAACKKIRDKHGVWHQIEGYLNEHSELEFSRGLCPECRKKWLPGATDKTIRQALH